MRRKRTNWKADPWKNAWVKAIFAFWGGVLVAGSPAGQTVTGGDDGIQAVVGGVDEAEMEQYKRARYEIRGLAVALNSFQIDTRSYPLARTLTKTADLDAVGEKTSKDVLDGPYGVSKRYIRTIPDLDPWGNPYLYEGNKDHFLILSTGPDGLIDPEYKDVRDVVYSGELERKGDMLGDSEGDDLLWADYWFLLDPCPSRSSDGG